MLKDGKLLRKAYTCYTIMFIIFSGVLLSAVNRTDFENGKNAFLIVLDAKTMKELARVEFSVPRFPRDFHGIFKSA